MQVWNKGANLGLLFTEPHGAVLQPPLHGIFIWRRTSRYE